MGYSIQKQITDLLTKSELLANQTFLEDGPLDNNSQLLTPAAVLIPIIQHENYENILFTQRADNLKHHPGQISFPGGCVDSNDSSPLECALRETHEEVGIKPDSVQVLGQMGEWRSYSGFSISVFIGLIKAPVAYQLSQREVSETIEIPTRFLLDPKQYEKTFFFFKNHKRHVYQTHYQGKKIWGFTGGIMHLLSKLLLHQT